MKKVFLLLALFGLISAAAQKSKPLPVSPAADVTDDVLYRKLKFRLIGPFRGGRSGAVAGSYTNRTTFYFGGTGGGVWKTSDGGSNSVSYTHLTLPTKA